MLKQRQYMLNISIVLAVTILFLIASLTSSITFAILYIAFIATLFSFRFISSNKRELKDTITVFCSFVFCGFILAFAVNYDYITNGITFLYPDQMHFFEEAKKLSLSSSISNVVERAFITDYLGYQAVYFIFGIIAYVDRMICGDVNFLPLLYSVVYTTALIPVFLYHTIKLYTTRENAFKSTLYYALLTPIMAYSGYLLRDMHISLIVMVTLYMMARKVNLFRIILITLLIPITFLIRESNALLIIAMLAIYIFTGDSPRLMKTAFILLGVSFFMYTFNIIFEVISATGRKLDNYQDYTTAAVEGAGNLGKTLYSLPPVIKEISISLFTLSAFPFFRTIGTSTEFPQIIMVLYNSITNIGWFFVFFGVIYFSKQYIKVLINMPNKMLIFLSFLFVFYMIMNVSNMTFRRLICAFPFVYIPFLLAYFDSSDTQKKNYKIMTVFVGIGLYIIYFILLLM